MLKKIYKIKKILQKMQFATTYRVAKKRGGCMKTPAALGFSRFATKYFQYIKVF